MYQRLPPKLQQRDATLISSAFLTDYFADVQKLLFFREQFILLFIFLLFGKTSVNFFPPRPNQTNVDSHIFVLMYVDDKIVKGQL